MTTPRQQAEYNQGLYMEKWPLAITDLETTGFKKFVSADPGSRILLQKHEIIEIGVILVDRTTFQMKRQWQAKVRPEHIEDAEKEALVVNGYSPEAWRGALSLWQALDEYRQLTEHTIFAGDNITYDYTLLEMGFARKDLQWDAYRRPFDVCDWAKGMLEGKGYPVIFRGFNAIARWLGISEPPVHRAINGALKVFKVMRAVRNLPPAASL